LINQIIKSGEFAGSEAVQHIVDCSIILDSDDDTPLKFLRATKNRFGDITEVGVFQHTDKGLEEVTDPAGIFIDEYSNHILSGSSCSFINEGIRNIPVEIQALVSNSTLPTPRKQFNGVNYQRGQIVCAILDKFCNTRLFEKDVFVSTLSGIKVNDPQADLSIAASIFSSTKDAAFAKRTVFVGELSLTGQVRGNFMIEGKIKEAQRLGFERIIVPENIKKKINIKKYSIEIGFIASIKALSTFS
jgi:DNA repair protein RadA/Sms